MTLDELIEQKRKEKVREELNTIVQKKLQVKQEEQKKQREQKNAERVQNVMQKTADATSKFKSNVPVAQKYYEKRAQEEKARQQQVAKSNENKVNLPVNTSQNVQVSNNKLRSVNKANLPTFTGVAPNNVKTKKTNNNLLETIPKIFGNIGYGAGNGLIAMQQAFNRNIQKQQDRDKELFDNINKKVGAPTVDEMNKKTFGDQKKEPLIDLEKQKQINNQKIQENIGTSSKGVGKKLSELAPTVGQMLPGMASGGVGTLYFAGSAKGNYYDEAKQRGMSDEQADLYSGTMALLEAGGETLGATLTKTVGKSIVKGGLKQGAKMLALDVTENVAEEAVMEPLSELTATAVAGKEYANWDNIGKRMLQAGIDGGLVGMIMGGASAGIGSAVNVANKISKGQTVTQNEINAVKQDVNNRMTDKQVQQKLQEAQDIINKVQNEPVNTQTQQITGQENKMAQNGNMEQIKGVENNEQTLYNNNESESGTNGKQQTIKSNDQRGTTGLFTRHEERTTNGTGYQENNAEQITRTKQEEIGYIRKLENQTSKLNNNQSKIKEAFEGKGAKVVFYSLDSNKGGYYDKGTLYINQKNATDIQQLNEATHEYAHYLIRDNAEFNQKVSSIAEQIVKNEETGSSEAIRNYIMDRDTNISVEDIDRIYQTVVEEILSDYAIDISNNIDFNIDNQYGIDVNILDEYKTLLKEYLPDIKIENSSQGSFNLPIQNITAETQSINNPNNVPYSKEVVQNIKENQYEKYNQYKKNILQSRANEVNNLISYKNETIRNIETKILQKQELLNSKKNKDTKVAGTIRSQIERLKMQKAKVENLYNEKIDKVNAKTNKEKINYETRNLLKKEAREVLKAEIAPLTADLSKYKDKKAGILYNRETAQRNIDDIVSDKELAEAIKETIFNPVQIHQAQKNREVNRLFEKINSLKLDKTKRYEYTPEYNTIYGEVTEAKRNIKIDEATLAQLLIEKKITDMDLANKYNMTKEQIDKIHKTANTFSEILDYLYNRMNEEQIKYGYSPIGKINNYFPHFFENKPDTMLGKIASYFGIDLTKQDLPTEIAGKTDTFKPGKTWNSNTLQRKTEKTDYDALKAMEKYIQGATDIIYTTEDIQKIREYERQIRYQYSEKGIQESIDNILNDTKLTQEAKEASIDGIFNTTKNELSNFVTWLNDYGNTLANKKAFSDRNMERNIGRNLYTSMSGIESRIASNIIGGNLSVSLTNIAPLFQAMGTTKVNYLLTGMLQTTKNNIKAFTGNKDVSFVNNSTFLTNLLGVDSITEKTNTQKISNFASVPMNLINEFTAESIVRAKYLENIDKGMTEEQALDNADKYTGRLMADRSKGALPIMFNSKNPLSKLVTMFQVEPNNMVSNYLKDMPREAKNKKQLTYQYTKLMIASYAFNTLIMGIRGGNEVLPDPIRWVSYLIKAVIGDEEEREKATTDLFESILGSVPFTSNIAGIFGIEEIGRVPISNAMPNLSNIAKVFDDSLDSKYRMETALKEISKPFLYLGLLTGGAQIKKSVEGISTVLTGGSYKTNSEGEKVLQFPVENASVGNYIKAGIFGKYSLPLAKEYEERNYKSLSAKQTKTYEESNVPYKEYLEYIGAKLKTNEDKINYISQKNWSESQKWGIYINNIFSSTERKEDGGSQVTDAKYITSNGVSKSKYIDIYNKAQKNNIDMPTAKEYKQMQNKGISLENYMNFKIEVKKETAKQKNNGTLKETQQLKNADKIQILLNANYSNKEKSAIYEEYIKSSNDTEFSIMKTTGIDIIQYLKYKQQEFTSDKKDDGTLKGKTIKNSEQKKVTNYLNSMNITGNQRLLLFAMQGYTTTSSQKKQLANYVNGLNLSKEDKLKLFDKFSGFTVYKNGRVTW